MSVVVDKLSLVEDVPSLDRPLRWALAVVLAAMAGFFLWAALVPLKSAAVASGTLKVESHRKTVQHLDGGIIKQILVREGDAVEAGQTLIILDDTQARASHALVQGQYNAALARRVRLQAEMDGAGTVVYPPELKESNHADLAVLLQRQNDLFTARREAHHGQIAILRKQVAQIGKETDALEIQAKATESQLRYINQELEGVRELLEKGLERKPRYLALQRTSAELEGQYGSLVATIARSRQAVAGAELQIVDLENRRRSEVASELEATQKELGDLGERLNSARDVLAHTVITAPQKGLVVDLKVFTPGGVIRAGDPLLDIVPREDELVVEARIEPADIDAVHPGLPAEVELSAYNRRQTPLVKGEVERVSADLFVDPQTSKGYYVARVRLDARALAQLEDVKLYPGMPVRAMIVTGEQTVLTYLISPITSGFLHTFREQ